MSTKFKIENTTKCQNIENKIIFFFKKVYFCKMVNYKKKVWLNFINLLMESQSASVYVDFNCFAVVFPLTWFNNHWVKKKCSFCNKFIFQHLISALIKKTRLNDLFGYFEGKKNQIDRCWVVHSSYFYTSRSTSLIVHE